MTMLWIVLVFGLLFVAALAGLYSQFRKSEARAQALGPVAARLDLLPIAPEALVRGEHPGEADVWDAAGAAFGLARGNRGIVSNLFHGRGVWLFDFSYARVPGSSSLRATVVSVAQHGPLPAADRMPPGPGTCVVAGDRLVCHSAPAADGRLPVDAIPSLVAQALTAARPGA